LAAVANASNPKKIRKVVMKKNLKICLAASAGGHLTQLLKLSESFEPYQCIYVSTSDVVAEKLSRMGQYYIIGEANRNHPFKLLVIMLKCIKIVFDHRPDVVISTGAAPALLVCVFAKLFGAKIIWIDSIANTEKLSMSGSLIRPFSDLFITQWPHLAKKYKKVEFVGTII
jgi:UDP-N-acetylglucosamine:LPS N-acetylglucosamine transferase